MKNFVRAVSGKILPQGVKNSLLGLGLDLAPERFHDFAFRYAKAPNMELGLAAAAKRGFAPRHVIDIGAFHGEWTQMAHSIWPDARKTMIEGNHAKEPRLKEVAAHVGADLHLALLGAQDGHEVDFHVMESGSSVYEENSPIARKTEKRTLRALDGLIPDTGEDVFIKLDTQGYELEILRGAPRAVANAVGIMMEVSLIEINKGAPLLADVVSFMGERGFVAYEITEIHRRLLDGAMNQIDILFIPNASPLIENKAFS